MITTILSVLFKEPDYPIGVHLNPHGVVLGVAKIDILGGNFNYAVWNKQDHLVLKVCRYNGMWGFSHCCGGRAWGYSGPIVLRDLRHPTFLEALKAFATYVRQHNYVGFQEATQRKLNNLFTSYETMTEEQAIQYLTDNADIDGSIKV